VPDVEQAASITALNRSSLLSKWRYNVLIDTPASSAMRLTELSDSRSQDKARSAASTISARLARHQRGLRCCHPTRS